jgi:hypothetical protein
MLLGQDRAERGHCQWAFQVSLEVCEDGQRIRTWSSRSAREGLDTQRIDDRRHEIHLVGIPAAQSGDRGAGGGSDGFHRHSGVSLLLQFVLGGGQDRRVESRVARPTALPPRRRGAGSLRSSSRSN